MRRGLFPDGVHAGCQIGKEGYAVRSGGLCGQNRTGAAEQFKDSALQEQTVAGLLGHPDFSGFELEGDACGLQRIGRAVQRNHDLLNGHAGNADEEVGFLLIRRDGFHGNGKPVEGRRDLNGIAAPQIVVIAVCTGAVACQRSHGFGDADQVGVCGERDGADVLGAGHAQALVGCRDLAGDGRAGDAVFCKPSGIGEIHRRSAARKSVEVVHVPIAPDVLCAFQLLDDLPHGELPGNAAPNLVVGIAAIERHERIGVAQHPGQRVHGPGREAHARNTAATRVIHKVIHIHQHIGTFGGLAGAGAFTGAGEIVLQAVDGEALQIVRRRVDRPMGWGLCDLRIGAVPPRTAIERGLPGIEAAHAAVDVLERKAVHRGGHQGYAHGLHLPHFILGIGEIRDRAGVPVRRAGFRSHHKASRVIRPLHGAVGKIVAIQETNLIPAVTALIQFGREDLHDRVPHKLSQVTGADVAFHRIGVDPVKDARIGGHADIFTGHSECQLIRVFIGWKKFCPARIRKRLGCIAGFILLRLKRGIIIRCFRNRLLFVRHSILLCFRRFRFRTLCRLCAADDEQGHHANVRHALTCGDVLDLGNLHVQQKMRIQVTRLHIAADHFTGVV